MVHSAQLCPLHLTPDCWRSFIATRFCLLHWKLFEILRRFVRKADSFQRALQLSPQAFRGGEHKSQMHLHCTPHPPPLSPVPPLCLLHLLRESFFNTSCIADIMKWPPDRSLPQSPLIFPSTSTSLSLALSLSPVVPSLRLHLATISLYAHLFFPSFSLDSRSLSTFIISLGVCFAPISSFLCFPSPLSYYRSLRSACLPGHVLLHLSGVMKSPSPRPSLSPNPSASSFKMTSFPSFWRQGEEGNEWALFCFAFFLFFRAFTFFWRLAQFLHLFCIYLG